MSLSVDQAPIPPVAQPGQANGSPAQTGPPKIAPVVRANEVPVVKAEPLVDPKQLRENLHAAIEKLNEQVERNGRGLNFVVDEKLGRPIITVLNTDTGEVVRTIPTEVIIKVAHDIEDLKGLLMDLKL